MTESRSYKIIRAIALSFLALFVLFPLLVVITTAFKPLADVRGDFTWLPKTVTFRPFIDMWSTVSLAQYFKNSLFISLSATVLSLIISVFASYAVARLRFKAKRPFTVVILSTQMFPGILFLLPLFLLFTQVTKVTGIRLNGSYLGLIITYMTFTLPFAIWMLSGYLSAIPASLEEAAMIDGTSRLGALFRVIIPIAIPGLIAVGIYSFITAWGEVLFASVLTNSSTRTLSIGLQTYSSQSDVLWNQLMAASITISLPIVIAFLFIQRFLVAGLSAGAVK